ncbi:MAG: hypothetical protein R3F29_10750 [Planctomycetota bacterium]
MKTSLLNLAVLAGLATAANAQAFNWTLETPGTSPTARERVATGTDGTLYYLYGGQNGTSVTNLDDLWTYDGTTWTQQSVPGFGPGTRAGAVGAYDVARGKFVVFGGKESFATGAPLLNDTWEWDTTNGWVQITTSTTPDARWLVNNGVYVPGLGVMFHGGVAIDSLGTTYRSNETWLFTGGDWVLFSNGGPAVQDPMMVYRSNQNDLIVHSGQTPTGPTTVAPTGETWRFDLGTGMWNQIVTATTPVNSLNPAQFLFAAMAYYNPNTSMMIVHGGNGANSSSSTWQFDGTDWKNISTNGVGCRNGGMHWINALGKAVYGPCNEANGAKNRTRSHGPSVQSSVVSYGSGCNGQAGTTLTFAADNDPWTAMTWSGTCTDMSAASPIKLAIWGFATTALPVTGILGAGAGCTLLNTADTIEVGFSASTTHTVSFAIPANPALAGIQLHVQAAEVDLSLLNFALSNGLTLTIGG